MVKPLFSNANMLNVFSEGSLLPGHTVYVHDSYTVFNASGIQEFSGRYNDYCRVKRCSFDVDRPSQRCSCSGFTIT